MTVCSVCGGTRFERRAVLGDLLVEEWGLTARERDYVDRQQGCQCVGCGANLRSIALAEALRTVFGTESLLGDFVKTERARKFSVLEINEAGFLTPVLAAMPGHVFRTYPDIDMHAMPFAEGTFDVVTHSDTLEHVADPVRALAECRRILTPNGALCFTIPIIVDRMTRSRAGLPKSYHGNPDIRAEDYVVHWEFGADAWTRVMEAGFSSVQTIAVDYPAALALIARP